MTNWVCMIEIGCHEKLLNVISGLPHRTLEVTLHGSDELIIGVASLLVLVPLIAAGNDRDSLGPSLWPPLVTFGVPLCALADCLERRFSLCPCWLPIVLDEDGPDCLHARGMPGGDVEELLRGLWLVTIEVMQQGSTIHVGSECQDDVGVVDLGELMTLLGEMPNVIR
jgi:hypothetical protein